MWNMESINVAAYREESYTAPTSRNMQIKDPPETGRVPMAKSNGW
jgi:hypothetical protein